MKEVNAFITAEGESDYDFLPVLLERSLNRVCLPHMLRVGPVQPLRVSVQPGETKHTAICRVATAASSGMTLLFHHYDGSADIDRETKKYWHPLLREWETSKLERPVVRVTPIREMESWALADTDVLRKVAGSKWSASEVFEANRMHEVEKLSDPKRTLKEIIAAGRRRRRAGREARDYLPLLAETISLDCLDRVPSYCRRRDETIEALRKQRLIRD